MASPPESIAFIGLGVMGYGMAVNLRTKIDPSTTMLIGDVNEAALDRFKAEMSGKGPIEVIKDGAEAASKANIIITMLPGPAEVKDVYLNPRTGVMAGAKQSPGDKLFIECGTIDVDVTIDVGKTIEKSGTGYFVDAPVSGGPGGANSGTLAFMVGCKPEAFLNVKTILLNMGKPDGIFHCGELGDGEKFKILNNYLSGIIGLATSETLHIGIKAGLDPKKLTNVIQASGGQCWMLDNCNPVPGVRPSNSSSRKYEGGFRVELCTKVFKMGTKLAKSVGAKTMLSKATEEGYQAVCDDERYNGKDARIIYKWLADEAIGEGRY